MAHPQSISIRTRVARDSMFRLSIEVGSGRTGNDLQIKSEKPFLLSNDFSKTKQLDLQISFTSDEPAQKKIESATNNSLLLLISQSFNSPRDPLSFLFGTMVRDLLNARLVKHKLLGRFI